MKKLFTLFSLCFSLLLCANAQSDGGHEDGSRSERRDSLTAYLRGTSVVIDNQTFDYRVLKYYNEETLQILAPVKRKQIYFIYNQSYTVLDMNICKNMLPIDIDVARLEIFRKENQRVIVEYGNDCKVHVELLSRSELNAKMEEITKL